MTRLRRLAARSGEVLSWAGVLLIAYGLTYIHPALPPIVLGVACLAAARSE